MSLDREEQDHYDLVVIAKDNGAIPKSASSLVKITVDDINDNVPKFERQSYNRTIFNQDQSGIKGRLMSYYLSRHLYPPSVLLVRKVYVFVLGLN